MNYKSILALLFAIGTVCCCESESNGGSTYVKPSEKPVEVQDDSTAKTWVEKGMENKTYITNGIVQIGVDLDRGGSIFHFSEYQTKRNLLNHADEGRFIQQSYYGDYDGSKWGDADWTWNPIQGGGSDGTKAKTRVRRISKSRIYVETEPVSWGAVNGSCPPITNCTMIEDITLEGYVAILKLSFVYDGTINNAPRPQELPAFFCDYDLGWYVYYKGSEPWKNKAVTKIKPMMLGGIENPNPESKRAEEWSAYVDSKGWGIGLYTPGTPNAIYYVAGTGPGGATSGSCSYFAPVKTFSINHTDSPYTYTAYLTIGSIDDMRERFYEIHKKL